MHDNAWLYWEGPQPPYITLCIETAKAHLENLRILDRPAFEALFTVDRDIDIDRLSLNHKSDFIRSFLLCHYGGIYIDADCIVLRDLGPILEMARQCGFVGYREPLGYMSTNFMASVSSGSVIGTHYRLLCQILRSRRPLGWLDLASMPMDKAIAAHPGASRLLPVEQVMPVPWNQSEQLCIRRPDEEHVHSVEQAAFCYMLSHNTIKSREATKTLIYLPKEQILREHYFIAHLFRRALNAPAPPWYDVPEHLGGDANKTLLDEGALDALIDRFALKSMVDIGCGSGGMVYYAAARGLRALGVDGNPNVARCSPYVVEHDYCQGPLYLGEFDLAWSVEFLQQVEERYLPNVMETFLACRYALITAAVPGQTGWHHVNCQWPDSWIQIFETAGFRLDQEATELVRRTSTMASRFTAATGLLFHRG